MTDERGKDVVPLSDMVVPDSDVKMSVERLENSPDNRRSDRLLIMPEKRLINTTQTSKKEASPSLE